MGLTDDTTLFGAKVQAIDHLATLFCSNVPRGRTHHTSNSRVGYFSRKIALSEDALPESRGKKCNSQTEIMLHFRNVMMERKNVAALSACRVH
jgi:hypothetical protein